MDSKGERLKKIRETLNLSQDAFGKQIGVTRSAISNVEQGTRNMSEQTLKSICREYHVSYTWLMTGEGDMFINDKELHESLDKILASDHDIHKAIVKFVLNLNEESIQNFENICSFFTNKKD